MKILTLTDLNWNLAAKKISREDILYLYESNTIGSGERFSNLSHYFDIIRQEQPELVLLGGDLTGDGSCGHGFHTAFYYLLTLLDINRITSLFIRGDNDLAASYQQVLENLNSFSYIHEISDKLFVYKNLKIQGLSFQTTNNKKAYRSFLKRQESQIDIILCHSELKRRTNLFSLNTDLCITGHFDNKFFQFGNTTFLSFSNDSNIINYGTIMTENKDSLISYHFWDPRRTRKILFSQSRTAMLVNKGNELVQIDNILVPIVEFEALLLPRSDYEKSKNALALAIKYLRGQAYREALTFLLESRKNKSIDIAKRDKLLSRFITSKHKLSKTMIKDYIGRIG